MDTRVRQIVEGFERLLRLTESSFLATVESEPGQPIVVKDLNETEYRDVRVSATDGKSGFILNPKKGSWIIVSRISNSNQLYISMVSEVDSVEIMGGVNGGLIKIEALETKLNQLITEVNALKTDYVGHTHSTPAGLSTAPAVPFTGAFSQFKKADFENDKVTH